MIGKEYKDGSIGVIERAIDDFRNSNLSTQIRKRAGQIILEENKYLESKFPDYRDRVRTKRLMGYLTQSEKEEIGEMAQYSMDEADKELQRLTRPRINSSKYETDQVVQIIIPEVSNFIIEQKKKRHTLEG